MDNSVFFKILKTFSGSEFKEFDKFVHSPFYNTSKATVLLFEQIREYYPDFESSLIEREKLFSAIHPDKKYDDVLMRKYVSNLIKLADEYLTLKTLSRKGRIKKRFLLEELRLRKLNSYYERKLKESESDFSDDKVIDREYFIDKYFHEHEKIYHYVSVNKQIKIPPNVIKRSDYLVYFFIQELVHNKLDIKVNEHHFNFNTGYVLINGVYSSLDISNILNRLKEKAFEDNFLKLYLYLGRVLLQKDDISFFNTWNLFRKLMRSLDFDLKNLVFAILESFCIHKINNQVDEDDRFSYEIFNIYELMLRENIFLYPDNNFKTAEFRNVLVSSLMLKKTEWAMNFIKKYSCYLDENIRADFVNYSYAKVYNLTENHEEVMKFLSGIKHEDFLNQLDIRNMLMQAYYKLGMFEHAFSLIDTCKKLLSNSVKLSKHKKDYNYGFINYYTKLLKIKIENNKPKAISDLKLKIQTDKNIMSRDWLLKEIDLLEN